MSTGVGDSQTKFMLAAAKKFCWNSQDSITDCHRGAAIKSRFDTGDFSLAAGKHPDLSVASHNLVGNQVTKFNCGRQRSDLKADGLGFFAPHNIRRGNIDCGAAGCKISRIQCKFKPAAVAVDGWIGIQAQTCNRRLSHSQNTAAKAVL